MLIKNLRIADYTNMSSICQINMNFATALHDSGQCVVGGGCQAQVRQGNCSPGTSRHDFSVADAIRNIAFCLLFLSWCTLPAMLHKSARVIGDSRGNYYLSFFHVLCDSYVQRKLSLGFLHFRLSSLLIIRNFVTGTPCVAADWQARLLRWRGTLRQWDVRDSSTLTRPAADQEISSLKTPHLWTGCTSLPSTAHDFQSS